MKKMISFLYFETLVACLLSCLSVKHHFDLKTTWNMDAPSNSFIGHIQTCLSHQSLHNWSSARVRRCCVCLGSWDLYIVLSKHWLQHITEPCFRCAPEILTTEIVVNISRAVLYSSQLFHIFNTNILTCIMCSEENLPSSFPWTLNIIIILLLQATRQLFNNIIDIEVYFFGESHKRWNSE